MIRIALTTALFCMISQFAYTQLKMEISAGFTRVPTELSGTGFGYFVAAAPSFKLKDKFRLRTTLQYRPRINNFNSIELRNLDLIPELEYTLFDFLSVGAGVFYSYSLNKLISAAGLERLDLGLAGSVKANFKNTFAFFRYNYGLVGTRSSTLFSKIRRDDSPSSFSKGYFQLGVGYSFGKKG